MDFEVTFIELDAAAHGIRDPGRVCTWKPRLHNGRRLVRANRSLKLLTVLESPCGKHRMSPLIGERVSRGAR